MSDTTIHELAVDELDSTQTERYLTFMTDGLVLGVSTHHAIEIIANSAIRPLPLIPDYVRGVINLRGQVLPIIDMRLRMNKAFQEYTTSTCIIILEIDSSLIGLAVDSVLQVLDLDTSNASPIPIENQQDITNAMVSMEDGSVVLLLDCDAIVKTI